MASVYVTPGNGSPGQDGLQVDADVELIVGEGLDFGSLTLRAGPVTMTLHDADVKELEAICGYDLA